MEVEIDGPSHQAEHTKLPFPSWATYQKPSSVVQDRILAEINSGAIRRYFDWEILMVKHLHQSRATSCQSEEEEHQGKETNIHTKKTRCTNGHGQGPSKVSTKNGKRNPHLDLKSEFSKIVDGKFINRLGGSKPNVFAFSEIQPGLSTNIRTLFHINTNGQKQLGKYDVFYYSPNIPTTSAVLKLKLLHPTLFLIPPKGDCLQLYNLMTGNLENSIIFDGSTRYTKATFQPDYSSVFVSGCKKCTLPREVFDDVLKFSYPPLYLTAHIQVTKIAAKLIHLKELEFSDEYLIMQCSETRKTVVLEQIFICDLQKLMAKSRVASWTNFFATPSHVITEFTDVLINVKSNDDILAFDPTDFPIMLTKISKEMYELSRLTKNGLMKIETEDDLLGFPDSLPDDVPVRFLQNYGPRIILTSKGKIKILGIENDLSSTSNCKLTVLFDKNYNCESTSTVGQVPRMQKRSGLRETSFVSYDEQEIYLDTSENSCVMHLAVVRFARRSIQCYIYDSYSYELQYKLNHDVFNPKKDEMYDKILAQFIENIVAVQFLTRGETKRLFTFNLLRGLQEKVL